MGDSLKQLFLCPQSVESTYMQKKHVLIYGIRHHSVTNEIEEGTLTTSIVLPEG